MTAAPGHVADHLLEPDCPACKGRDEGIGRVIIEVSERLDRLHMSFDEHVEVSGEHIARLDSRFDNVNARCDRADLQLQAAAWVGLVWAPAAVLLAYLAG